MEALTPSPQEVGEGEAHRQEAGLELRAHPAGHQQEGQRHMGSQASNKDMGQAAAS